MKPSRGGTDESLEAIVGLHRELQRRASEAIATPEEARRANTELRELMRERANYLSDIEDLAEEQVRASGHRSGALTHREVSVMAERLGFQLIYVNDLPDSTRSITDRNGRIYLPPASIPGGHGLRSMALQAMAHRLLGHTPPASYDEFLWQRLEINYAAACLMPQDASVAFLQEAKKEKRLAIEDFRDAFGVTHEAAALRFTNLATSRLDMTVHFLRVNGDGALLKGYENDGLPLPTDVTGSIEGQWVCKKWSARTAFAHTNRDRELPVHRHPGGHLLVRDADRPNGCLGVLDHRRRAVQPGEVVPRRETTLRAVSTCPGRGVLPERADGLAERWAGQAWPSARLHAHVLSPLPSGTFPGVDDAEVYAFLEAHADE